MKAFKDVLSERLAPITTKWTLLADRDRLALTVLGLFFCILILFYFVWKPLQSWSDLSKRNYENKQALVEWIQQNKPVFLAAKGGGANKASSARKGRSVLSLVNQEARRQALNIKRVEPKDDNQLRVWVDSVKFNNLIGLLDTLEKRYSIQLLSLSLEKGRDPGLVNATLILGG